MKKGTKRKWGVLTAALLMAFAWAVTASAEENGYWTETVDSEGRQIRIFTYTEPVVPTFEEDGWGCLPEEVPAQEDVLPVAVEENAAPRLAEGGVKTAQAMPAGADALGSVAVLGVAMLVILGVALYKAV